MSYKLLAAKSQAILATYPIGKSEEDKAWEGSSFDWFRKRASATKGKIGRDLSQCLVQAAGFESERVGMALKVNGKLIRIKTSLMWGAGGFTFEQLGKRTSTFFSA